MLMLYVYRLTVKPELHKISKSQVTTVFCYALSLLNLTFLPFLVQILIVFLDFIIDDRQL